MSLLQSSYIASHQVSSFELGTAAFRSMILLLQSGVFHQKLKAVAWQKL